MTYTGIGMARLMNYAPRFVGSKTAIIDEKAQVTFAQSDAMSNRLARAYQAAGARGDDRIALILPNSIAFIVVEIAIVKAGMVKVPLNYRFHPKETCTALADCEPAILVCDAAYYDGLRKEGELPASIKAVFTVGGARAGCLAYEEATSVGDAGPIATPYRPDSPVLIRYTGGTTGRPKGIVHTDRTFMEMHRDLISEFIIREWDTALHIGHLSHGTNFAWAAFYGVGATQVVRERFDPVKVLQDLEKYRVTFTYMVPTMLSRVAAAHDGTYDTSSLKRVWVSSAPIPVPVIREAVKRFGNIFNQAYTLSECPPVTSILRPEECVEKETSRGTRFGSCGREALTQEIRLVDDGWSDVPAGEVGEIAIRSVDNMCEYWRLPEETAATLKDGWLKTGDMAARDEDAYLYIVDRKKDLIITGGFNVYPKEVEDILYTHEAVAEVGVVGVPDEDLGEAVKAYVVLREGQSVAPEALVRLCRDNLASYKKPRAIEFVKALPLTPVGKVSRKTLREEAKKGAKGA